MKDPAFAVSGTRWLEGEGTDRRCNQLAGTSVCPSVGSLPQATSVAHPSGDATVSIVWVPPFGAPPWYNCTDGRAPGSSPPSGGAPGSTASVTEKTMTIEDFREERHAAPRTDAVRTLVRRASLPVVTHRGIAMGYSTHTVHITHKPPRGVPTATGPYNNEGRGVTDTWLHYNPL